MVFFELLLMAFFIYFSKKLGWSLKKQILSLSIFKQANVRLFQFSCNFYVY